MAREKKPVHKVQMTEGKRNIIRQLLEEYDIESAQDIQDALKDLTDLWWLRYTQLIAKPSLFRVFPFFDPCIRDVRNPRLVVSIPDSYCTYNIHIRSIKK